MEWIKSIVKYPLFLRKSERVYLKHSHFRKVFNLFELPFFSYKMGIMTPPMNYYLGALMYEFSEHNIYDIIENHWNMISNPTVKINCLHSIDQKDLNLELTTNIHLKTRCDVVISN